jgi:hypothetical protein
MLAFIMPVRTAAQDYHPVHATVHVLPPYSLYLSDYSNGFRDRLVVTFYNRDLQQQTLDCRLRLRISNTSGFCIESRDEVPQRSITVEPNVPLRLTSQDIAPYLQTGNVKQTGTLRNGRLPEGMMTFSVQVVDYRLEILNVPVGKNNYKKILDGYKEIFGVNNVKFIDQLY